MIKISKSKQPCYHTIRPQVQNKNKQLERKSKHIYPLSSYNLYYYYYYYYYYYDDDDDDDGGDDYYQYVY